MAEGKESKKQAIPARNLNLLDPDVVRRALDTYAAAVRENATRPRHDKAERRQDDRLALVN